MKTMLAITRAIDDETRLRILMALTAGELCLCQLIELLSLSPSTVSRHMSLLQSAGLVERRKEGRWAYFRLASRGAPRAVRQALKLVTMALSEDSQIEKDARILKRIIQNDPVSLCGCYS